MNPQRSLLILADSLDGGMGAAVISQSSLFASKGWRVGLAAPQARSLRPMDGIDLDIPGSAFHVRQMLSAARQTNRLIKRLRPDVVHVHGVRTLAVVLASAHRPFVTLHGGGRNPGQTWLGTFVREVSRDLTPLLARGAFSVVPRRGLWTTMLTPSPRLKAMEGVSDAARAMDPTFLFVARLAPPKRPEVFIDAMALLTQRVPNAKGVIVGDGPSRPAVEAYIAQSGAPVELVGHVDDMTPWYGQAWGVCLFSDFEALPFVVQEAMWAARPVVTSKLTGVQWFADSAASYVSGPDQAVEVLHQLCTPSFRDVRGRAAQLRARTMLAPERLYQDLGDAYDVGVANQVQESS